MWGSSRKRVAILGGAFDPPTVNHMLGAAEVIHAGQADEVWLVPCGKRPDKPKLSNVVDRYLMAHIAASTAFSASFPVRVSDAEVHEPQSIPTYDLLRTLRDRHPDCDFSLIIGSDWLQPGTDIRQWTSKDENGQDIVTGDKLLQEFEFLVYNRPGYAVEKWPDLSDFGPRMKCLELPAPLSLMEGNLSSTEVRKRGSHEEAFEGLVTPAIISYICSKGLYGTAMTGSFRAGPATPTCCFGFVKQKRPTPARRNVAVFGGAFDPPTHSHIIGLAEMINAGAADEVLMVPCGPRPDKPQLRPALTRYIMCQLAVTSSFHKTVPIKVSDVEVFEKEALATYDSLRMLRAKDPTANLMFVIGSDWLQPGTDIRQWTSKDDKTGEEIVTGHKLVEEFDFLVIKRPGYEVEDPKAFGPRMKWMEMPSGMKPVEANMSSTEVRKRAAKCYQDGREDLQLIDGIVPPAVFSYIRREAIYKPQ